MKIIKLETVQIEEFPNLCFVLIHTDEDLVGLGETYFHSSAVADWIHETGALALLGNNPLEIEKHWNSLVGFIGSRSTGVENRGRSAIDTALWDIFGQATGVPIYQLLGGAVRPDVPIYNTCAGYQYTRKRPSHGHLPVENWGTEAAQGPYEDLEGFLHRADELAHSLVAEGYAGMKIWPFDPFAQGTGGHYITTEDLKKGLEPFEKIRAAVGDKIEIMVEMHSQWDLRAAKQIAHAVDQFRPFWFEDPIRMDNISALKNFAESTPTATAASETLGTRWAYREIMEQAAADVIIFDPSWTGGISEARRIGNLAQAYELPVAPHDCVGPVTFCADVHLSVHLPNGFIQEVVRAFYTSWYRELVTNLPEIKDGRIYPLTGPGLGTALNPAVFSRSDITRRVSK